MQKPSQAGFTPTVNNALGGQHSISGSTRTNGSSVRDGFHVSPRARSAKALSTAGFTLVEMIVAVALFGIVMLVSVTALVALVDANRKAQALQSVINNLNIAIDGMSRSIREGSEYRCGSSGGGDCTNGDTIIYFNPYGGAPGDQDDWVYHFHDGRIYKSENGNVSGEVAITASEVTIESVTFYVFGASRGDTVQPKVMMVIKGTAGTQKANVKTTFHVQSTAVQRILDI